MLAVGAPRIDHEGTPPDDLEEFGVGLRTEAFLVDRDPFNERKNGLRLNCTKDLERVGTLEVLVRGEFGGGDLCTVGVVVIISDLLDAACI